MSVAVGRRDYSVGGGKFHDSAKPGYKTVLCLTASTPYGSIGPYCVKDKNGHIMENAWQARKIYEHVPRTRQPRSRYDSTVIWEWPSEVHWDGNGPTPAYWKWRAALLAAPEAVRYPVGRAHRKHCKGFLWRHTGDDTGVYTDDEEDMANYQLLDYVEARKVGYVPVYMECLRDKPKFVELQQRHARGENLLIVEVDGPHKESLGYYQDTYGVAETFIDDDNVMDATPENLGVMLYDAKHPFGHGYCLAMALLGLTVDDLPKPAACGRGKRMREEEEEEDK